MVVLRIELNPPSLGKKSIADGEEWENIFFLLYSLFIYCRTSYDFLSALVLQLCSRLGWPGSLASIWCSGISKAVGRWDGHWEHRGHRGSWGTIHNLYLHVEYYTCTVMLQCKSSALSMDWSPAAWVIPRRRARTNFKAGKKIQTGMFSWWVGRGKLWSLLLFAGRFQIGY